MTANSLMAAARKRLGEEDYQKYYLRGKFTARAHILAWVLNSRYLLKNEQRPVGIAAIIYIEKHELLNTDCRYEWQIAQAHCKNLQEFKDSLGEDRQ